MSHPSLNVVKDHIQESSPKVDEHFSNDPLNETGSNRCFNLDLWRAAIRQWSERKSDLSQILAKLRWERSKIAANLNSQRIAPKSRKNHLSLRKIIDPHNMTGELEILSSVRNCQRFSLCKTKNLRPHLGHKSPLVGKKKAILFLARGFSCLK